MISLSEKVLSVNSFVSEENKIIDFTKENNIDCVVIGPERSFGTWFSDLFEKGFPVVGPLRSLAQIETSKGFTRDLLTKYNIDSSPMYRRFKGMNGAKEFIESLSGNYVVKFDGLMGGKGVKVSGEHLR